MVATDYGSCMFCAGMIGLYWTGTSALVSVTVCTFCYCVYNMSTKPFVWRDGHDFAIVQFIKFAESCRTARGDGCDA